MAKAVVVKTPSKVAKVASGVKKPKKTPKSSTKKAPSSVSEDDAPAAEEEVQADADPKPKKRKQAKDASSPKKAKKAMTDDADNEEADMEVEAVPASPNAIANFDMHASVKQLLLDKGITALFDIQASCYPHALAGKDVVGRARTGCGKTLAFVLPIVELLIREKAKPLAGAPNVICLLPTRELAKQVHEDFEYIGAAGSLRTVCVYGGSPYGPQEQSLRRGVHVVVGTPGRVKDHMERGNMKMSKLRFRVLDECDEMLNMGFADDVEKILGAAADAGDVQTMLFSATMPPWVHELQKKYLKPGAQHVDLVGSDKMKASKSVEHKALYCHWSQRAAIIQDLVKCYGFSGRTIIFCDTKNDTNELAATLSETTGARALHGDIAQNQREVTLKNFRDGKFSVLVATDVAARGLDIQCVDLVLQMDPPKDYETYIHRSGRTGRAGSSGVCITLVSRNKEDRIPWIQQKAGFTFERIGSPQPSEMAKVAARRAVETISEVGDSVVPWFLDAAKELLAAHSSPEIALAKALAKITGNVELKRRSLLTAHEDFTTFLFESPSVVDRPGYVFGYLRRRLNESQVDQVKGMRLTKDCKGAVFDVPSDLVDEFVSKLIEAAPSGEAGSKPGQQPPCRVKIAEDLPELKPRDDEGQEGGGSWGGRGGGSFGGRGGGRGFFGGRSSGRGGGGRSSSGGRGRGSSRGRH